ncbi:N-acetyltransferase [Pseudomonas lundensis]|uniref:N-acetyltransferase n=1 Tax=Pseudomonas lundensis TaxID=86185 RepID=UPI0018687A35|nr:N-acetyltransferase [Pseudomonas lundensis]
MDDFEPMRDFFHPRAAKSLNEGAARVHLINRWQESPRGNFVFPGTDHLDDIEVDGQRVGHVDYGINPLRDRVYINMFEIDISHQRQGIGLSVLWQLWLTHQVPILPLCQYTSSDGFWERARHRFAAAGAQLGKELRGEEQMMMEQQRWQHLVPEPDHLRKIRELKASPEWPAIKARMEAEYGVCPKN